jgi:uncharacterized protein
VSKPKVVFKADSGKAEIVKDVRRIDLASAPMKKPEILDNGWMRCDAVLTTTGVFRYLNADGTERRELRLPEDVFSPDSMKSFHLVPVTDDHPADGWLHAENTKQFACGAAELPHRDGDKMVASLLVTDGALVQKLQDGSKCQVSNGYFADLEVRSGTYNGEEFDCVQKNIRGNHVAIVDEARAGPSARVKLDAADGVMVPIMQGAKPKPTGAAMLKIDGVDFECPSQTAQAVERRFKKLDEKSSERDAQIAELTAKLGQTEGERDTFKSQAAKLDTQLKAAIDPKNIDAAVAARVSLVETARDVLGEDFKADGKPAGAIKAEVLAKLAPDVKLDGKSAEYVQAAFDMALALRGERNDGLANVREVIARQDREETTDASDPMLKLLDHNQNLWQHKLTGSSRKA